MISHLFIFTVALFMVARGATLATKYAVRCAERLSLSKYVVGFMVIAVISILPEALISINAAIKGVPSFGLGMLLGSNVADLTLIFALVIFWTGRNLKVEQKILKSHTLYPLVLFLPMVLGLDGSFSRLEGLALVVVGAIFYYLSLRGEKRSKLPMAGQSGGYKSVLMLLLSLAVLLVGAHFVVTSATAIASLLGVSSVLIGMLIVGLGTTVPELFFSIKSVKQNDDSLAVGDLLGTVLADATIVIGLLAFINPFSFPKTTIYIGGVFMAAAALILFSFMRSGRVLTKREAFALVVLWVTFVIIQFIVSI